MKIALIGNGKTGSKAADLLAEELGSVFNTTDKPTSGKLKKNDAVIIFAPGGAVAGLTDIVLEAGIPAAWGSTGFEWPDAIHDKVKAAGVKWVSASNFSIGMNIVRKCINIISADAGLLDHPAFHIHEIHHIHKKDSPSGTALSWKEWLGRDAGISAQRLGDVKGIHELKLTTQTEKITLKHEALDRAVFAEGAIWAVKQLVQNKTLDDGLYNFSELFDLITGN